MSEVKSTKIEKRDSYYIASGFFNPSQSSTVTSIEESMEGLGLKFFSPRRESIPFFSEKNLENKSMMTKLIFNNNLDCIDTCNKYIINLEDNDQGTLFEYGYIAEQFQSDVGFSYACSRAVKVMNDTLGLESLVLQNGDDLILNLVPKGKDNAFVDNLMEDFPGVKSYRKLGKIAILCIDDRDPINLFLIGACYKRGIPVVTYSHEGHGSNVMLVHSSTHAETITDLGKILSVLEKDLINGYSRYTKELEEEEKLEIAAFEDLNDYEVDHVGQYGFSSIYLNKQDWKKNID